MYGLEKLTIFVDAIVGPGAFDGMLKNAVEDLLLEDVERSLAERKEYIKSIAPPMARFDLCRGRGFGVIVKTTGAGVKVRMKNGQTSFRKFKRDNVAVYPAGVIFKN